MSRILRRPMFRGGSTSNEGIMSVPRKGYERAGFVNEEELGADEALRRTGSITTSPGITGLYSIPTSTPKQTEVPEQTKNTYKMFGKNIEKGSYDDEAVKLYLGKKADASSKFLINFGLKYMSARPRRGKFGLITTASDAAQKPTEELFADIDKERELKLKLMGILGKSEGKGSFEKEVNFIWETEKAKMEKGVTPTFKTKEEVTDYVRSGKYDATRRETSVAQQKRDRSKEIMNSVGGAPNKFVADSMAEFEIEGINKLPKEERAKLDVKGNTFLPSMSVKPKPNTNVFTLKSSDQSLLNNLEVGLNYVDPGTKSVYTYVDKNTFRFVSKY